jgi:hypothetical protein
VKRSNTDRAREITQVILLVGAVRVAAWFVTSPDARLAGDQLFASTFLLVVHSAFYWFGARFRAGKKGSLVGYLGIQGTLAAAIGLYSLSLLLSVLLFGVLSVQAYTLIRRALKQPR